MPCVFCGYPQVTKGHVLPRWMGKQGISPKEARLLQTDDKGRAIRDKPGALFADNARRVCQDNCNGGWMSRIEDAAKPTLERLIRGYSTSLSPSDQEHVAKWCSLVALMASFLQPEVPIPREHFTWMYQHKTPPNGTTVWLGSQAWRATDSRAIAYHRRALQIPWDGLHHSLAPEPLVIPEDVNCYYVTVSCYSLFQVLAVILPRRKGEVTLTVRRPPSIMPTIQAIWPQPKPLVWPPPVALDRLSLRALAEAHDKFELAAAVV